MLGVCYYPEHWSKEQITSDIPRMRELGIQWVRIGEFAWSLIEPAPGKFEWQWLDEVLNLFELEELKVILGTPTATPPKWLVDRYPDILPVIKKGEYESLVQEDTTVFLTQIIGRSPPYCFNIGSALW